MKKDSSAHSSSQQQSDNPNNNNNNNNNQQQPINTLSNAAAAAQSLQLLLREDTLLVQYELHKQNNNNNDAAFNYAAALLSSSSSSSHSSILQAQQALQEVERKLALAQSLSTKVSRTAPEHVAGPLLVLHGYQNTTTSSSSNDEKEEKNDHSTTNNTTLAFIQQRCHRLEKSGQILESTASRVENSLLRNYSRIKSATTKLARVLQLSQTLKLILKLHFETIQLQHYDVDIDTSTTSTTSTRNDDLRELIRASKSVCIVEELLQSDELSKNTIEVVRMLQPTCRMTATTVRTAAKSLLEQYHHVNTNSSSSSDLLQLANTLQVYYELQELPAAVWSIVESVLVDLQQEQQQVLWSTSTLQQLFETATNEAKMTMSSSSSDYGSSSAWQRVLQKKLKSARRSATSDWAGIVLQSSLHMFRLHRVLTTKTDTHRQLYNAVVANQSDEMPTEFVEYYENNNDSFSVFTMFWKKWCHDLQDTLSELVASYQDNNKNKSDSPVAAMYPAVRAACLDMLGSLQDAMQIGGSGASLLEQQHSSDAAAALSSTFTGGILGGSSALDEAVWSNIGGGATTSSPTTTSSSYTADTWTRAPLLSEQQDDSSVMIGDSSRLSSSSSSTTHHQIIFQSPEYKMLHNVALLPLQQAFTNACRERLVAPLRFMFPEGVAVDEDGIAMSVLPALPSRYDLQKLDANIRTELSLADPREGGGELSMTSMIAEVVVEMVEQFCQRAKGAVSHVGGGGGGGDSSDDDGGYLNPYDLSATEALQHNVKVAGVMSALATSLRNAPENTFVVPYRPATSAQHEEAASMCQIALMPALHEIESMVRSLILTPLCRALNRRVATAIAKLHHGTYLEQSLGEQNSGGGTGTSFVQKHLAGLYDAIAEQHLSKLPPEYASIVASTIATYSIYTFVSNVSLVRPLGETARLHLTQDLADFELALEQLVFKAGSSMSLAQVEKGKPYAELRAVRQMLFWTGLDNKSLSASALAKSILREPWAKDVRPSTVFHFLFSFGPSLLSSPHHSKRMRPEEYVGTLVQLDGSIDDGEASAWMTTMACCDSYQQRESVESGGGSNGGDRRIAAILMMLGPELLRRRRH